MPANNSYQKFVFKDVVFFTFLFILCLAGSIGIFWFAVGIENGNRILNDFLKSLLNNAVGIVVVLLLFNVFLVLLYSRKDSKRLERK